MRFLPLAVAALLILGAVIVVRREVARFDRVGVSTKEDGAASTSDAAPDRNVPISVEREPAAAAGDGDEEPGTVELVFVSELERPIANLRASIHASDDLPVDLHGMMIDAANLALETTAATSNDEGQMTFTVPPGTYAGVIHSAHVLWNRRDPRDGSPQRVTEPIAVQAGESTRLVVRVHEGVVTGFLVLHGALGAPANVRLLDLTDNERVQERVVETRDGSFQFEGVGSGRKLLSAVAVVTGQHLDFYGRRFEIDAASRADLGAIQPIDGPTSTGIVTFEMDGEDLSCADVYGTDQLPAVLILGARTWVEPNAFDVELVDVAVGRPFALHGLPAGEWTITAGPTFIGTDEWPQPRAGYEVATSAGGVCRVPFVDQRFAFPVSRPVTLDLRVLYPEGVAPFRAVVHLRSTQGRTAKVDVRPGRGEEGVANVRLAEGTWDVVAHADKVGPSESLSWFYEGRIGVQPPRSEIVITFEAGCVIEGTSPGRPLGWSLPSWNDAAGRTIDLWVVVPDAGGRFRLHGVPPGRTLVPTSSDGVPVTAGRAGETTTVAFERARRGS